MSAYNYDLNPWDDNHDPNAAQNSNQPRNYGGYTEGYSNPAADYPDSGAYGQTDQYQYEDEPHQQHQQQQPTTHDPSPSGEKQSALGRFIRERVPVCGQILDTLSSINLPFIDALVQRINRDLLVSKMFYFFFYSAFGSLFPLMGVYFKQQGMNPAQVGILTGVRPFIEIFSAPFWNSLAGRFQKSKALLLFSLISWIVFTYSLAHIKTPPSACVAFNDTDYVLYTPYSANDLSNYEVESTSFADQQSEAEMHADSRGNNEMFLNRLPPSLREGAGGSNAGEKEGKDQILASEENQNDQRRRRRRRRDTSAADENNRQQPSRNRYAYSVSDSKANIDYRNLDSGSSRVDLDIDLDNDFEDKLLSSDEPGHWSIFESDQRPRQPVGDDNELDQQQFYSLRGSRLRRSIGVKDIDDVLGESDEGDSDDQEQNVNEDNEQKQRESSGAAKDENVESGKADEQEGDEDEDVAVVKQQKDRESQRGNNNNSKPSQATKAAVAASSPTTTTQATTQAYAGGPDQPTNGSVNKTKRIYKQRHKTPPTHIVGMSPITVEYAVNYNKEKHSQFVTPMFSTIVYKLDDIKEVFFLLLLLISLGEFFSAPALTLADSATLSYLGDNTDSYGRQRMFGSLSWAITLLLVGMALDNAKTIADHPCGPHQRERSYTVCFVIFSLLMACAFLTATQFKFNYTKGAVKTANGGTASMMVANAGESGASTVVTTTAFDGSAVSAGGNIDQLYASTQPRSIFNTAPPVNAPPPTGQQDAKEKFEFLDKWRSAVFAQRTRELPQWVNVFRQFSNPLHLTYLFITWFLGCGVGLVFTFLFWHLQDVGGTPTLFGICSVINHISEILAYFFSFSFIKRFGHTKVSSGDCSSSCCYGCGSGGNYNNNNRQYGV